MHCVRRGGALQCEECIEGYHPYPEAVDNECITEEEFEGNNGIHVTLSDLRSKELPRLHFVCMLYI